MQMFWLIFLIVTGIKILLIPSYHSTDFEVHRNWLAVTHSLPLGRWYYEATNQWTLDYPPFFAYFEWLLSQIAYYVDPEMLSVTNINYDSPKTVLFQRLSVVVVDLVYALGVKRCLRALHLPKNSKETLAGEILLLGNIGLLFVDHIHFQYNGFLFGLMLFSISFILEERYLLGAFAFAVLLNFKHIFLYTAPAFAVFLLKFYILENKSKMLTNLVKLFVVGLTPFGFSFGPFWNQLPQVFSRLFPFKRGLTHAYWAPNFWSLYNLLDKIIVKLLGLKSGTSFSTSSGLVYDFEHQVMPTIRPLHTFILTFLFMVPVLIKMFFFTNKSEKNLVFLRSIVLCACSSFMFGWHVHEKAILMCLIPLSLSCLIDKAEAKMTLLLSFIGYFSLFPLLFDEDLIVIRYAFYLSYMVLMWSHLSKIHNEFPILNKFEIIYIAGLLGIPFYEHIASPALGLNHKLPFMPLLLTSVYCGVGVTFFFLKYYLTAFGLNAHLLIGNKTINCSPIAKKLKTK